MRAPAATTEWGRALGLGAALGALLLGGCQQLKVAQPFRAAEAPAPLAPPLELAWRLDADGAFGPAALLPTRDVLLLTTRTGDVALVSPEGREIGRAGFGDAIEGPIALVDGRRLVVALDGKGWGVVAYDVVEGRRLWHVLKHVAHPAGVVVAGQTVVAPARDGHVRGLDLATGAVRWTYDAGADTAAFVAPPLLLDDGAVVVADVRGRVAALDPATGRARWTADVGAPVYVPMAAGGRLLAVSTTRSTLTAFDPASGRARWTFTAPASGTRLGAPAVTADAVYAGASDGLTRRFDAATGAVRWTYTSDGHVSAAPLVAADLVYVGTLDERLVALDAGDGSERWAVPVGGRVHSAPVAWGRLLLLPAEPHFLRAYRAAAPTAGRLP